MLYDLMKKLNAMLGDGWRVTYRKDGIYTNGCLEYIIDKESYDYYKISIIVDGFQTYDFAMSNQEGERNVRCHYLKEAEAMDLFYKAIHKDLELYCY
jgi:hypothetical protein